MSRRFAPFDRILLISISFISTPFRAWHLCFKCFLLHSIYHNLKLEQRIGKIPTIDIVRIHYLRN